MNATYVFSMLACALAMVAMAVHSRQGSVMPEDNRRWFMATYLGIAACAAAECAGVALERAGAAPALHALVTLCEFCMTPLLAVAVSRACGERGAVRYVAALLAAHAVAEAALLPFGLVFRVDGASVYHRGSLYGLYVGAYAVAYGYLLAMFYRLSRRFDNRDLATLVFSLAVLLAGIVPSLVMHEARTSYVGLALDSIIIYCYYGGLAQQDLAADVAARTARIDAMQEATIMGMANLIESRDGETGAHVKNTSRYAGALAAEALRAGVYAGQLDEHLVGVVEMAAPLHDVGKIVVPDSILRKPGPLAPDEFEVMKRHAAEGGRIVHRVLDGAADAEHVRIAADIAEFHHERWDGAGYPEGLAGEEIPLCARIMAIADVYDALTQERVYKPALPPEEALAVIERDAGSHFDPLLAPLFVRLVREGRV